MFCPKCATQNNDDSKFCRACGTNLSLVPQAITGQLALTKRQIKQLERQRPPNMARGISSIFTGLGFLLVAFAISVSHMVAGGIWWYWMLIPAFSLLGKGVSEIYTAKQAQNQLQQQQFNQQFQQPPQIQQARNTGEIPAPPQRPEDYHLPPVSVTETTTRHLDAVPPRNRESQ